MTSNILSWKTKDLKIFELIIIIIIVVKNTVNDKCKMTACYFGMKSQMQLKSYADTEWACCMCFRAQYTVSGFCPAVLQCWCVHSTHIFPETASGSFTALKSQGNERMSLIFMIKKGNTRGLYVFILTVPPPTAVHQVVYFALLYIKSKYIFSTLPPRV